MSKPKYLRIGDRRPIVEPTQAERIERTEQELARRSARDWLRDRGEDDAPEWEDEPQSSWM